MTGQFYKGPEPKSGRPFDGRRAVAVQDRAAGPVLTAKGRGAVAEKILAIAFDAGVKVREDASLTEMLAAFDVDSPIPLEALEAVSEILERVYQEDRTIKRP